MSKEIGRAHLSIYVTCPGAKHTEWPEDSESPKAMVRAPYAVEWQARDAPVIERLELRQARSTPVLAELREKLLRWKEQLRPKHPMTEAVHYALGQWAELSVSCFDSAVPIDSNVSAK